MSQFKCSQRKYVKKTYRVRNWTQYEAGLRERGSLTVWISLNDGKLVNWDAPIPMKRKPGRQRKYSNHAIETAVTLGMVYGLASRQTEGFICATRQQFGRSLMHRRSLIVCTRQSSYSYALPPAMLKVTMG